DARDANNTVVQVTGSVRRPLAVIPTVTELVAAAPNPFSGSSTVSFNLAQRSRVEISIHAVDGRSVRTPGRETRDPREYRVVWDGRDDGGASVPPGMYYIRFETPGVRGTRPVVRLK